MVNSVIYAEHKGKLSIKQNNKELAIIYVENNGEITLWFTGDQANGNQTDIKAERVVKESGK